MRESFNKKALIAGLALTTALSGCSVRYNPDGEKAYKTKPFDQDVISQPLDVQCSGAASSFSGKAGGYILIVSDVITYIDKNTRQPKTLQKGVDGYCTVSDGAQRLNLSCNRHIPLAMDQYIGQIEPLTFSGMHMKFVNPATATEHAILRRGATQCVVYAMPREKSLSERFGAFADKAARTAGHAVKSVMPLSAPLSPKI